MDEQAALTSVASRICRGRLGGLLNSIKIDLIEEQASWQPAWPIVFAQSAVFLSSSSALAT
jgi:hypothetical protein